jgi:hypothetical protein
LWKLFLHLDLLYYGLVFPKTIVVDQTPLERDKPDEDNDDLSNGLSIIPEMALSNLDSNVALGVH